MYNTMIQAVHISEELKQEMKRFPIEVDCYIEMEKKVVKFSEYQEKARTTAIYRDPIVYPALGLAGEAGEVCEKVKKALRDIEGFYPEFYRDTDDDDSEFAILMRNKQQEVKKELGDVLWYISNLASDFGLSLEDVAQTNIEKLFSRKDRGVIGGSGDER